MFCFLIDDGVSNFTLWGFVSAIEYQPVLVMENMDSMGTDISYELLYEMSCVLNSYSDFGIEPHYEMLFL